MVGQYVAAIEQAGVADKTYLLLTSDHGDMRLEHQQFYKMV
jgi:arylsulfatase K